MRHPERATAASVLVAVLAAPILAPTTLPAREAKPGPLQATLEMVAPFTHEGDPLLVRVAVFNTGDRPYDNAAGIDILGGLKVTSASGARLDAKGKTGPDPKDQPAVIAAGGFFGLIKDLTAIVPGLAKAGTYTLTWESSGLTAPPLTLRVLPRFDPLASYVAVMETDYGYLEFDLRTKDAPKHVQNFHDLAMLGFYDNTLLHEVVKGVEIRGGDPGGTGAGSPGYGLDPEIAKSLKHKRGTLSSVRSPGRNEDNGSQFVIALSPREAYDGSLTIFGELSQGEETLRAIENIPTSGQRDQPPFFRPLKPVIVKTVTVKKAGGGSGR